MSERRWTYGLQRSPQRIPLWPGVGFEDCEYNALHIAFPATRVAGLGWGRRPLLTGGDSVQVAWSTTTAIAVATTRARATGATGRFADFQ
ncbi:hypothetical protein D3C71_1396240 [compost metagenome]